MVKLVNLAVRRVKSPRLAAWILIAFAAFAAWQIWRRRDHFTPAATQANDAPGNCARCTSPKLRDLGFKCKHPTRPNRCCKTASGGPYPQCKNKPKGGGGGGGGGRGSGGGGGGGGGGGVCTESWATCPSNKPYCYWGDKDYNVGKCCTAPWGTDCKDPGSALAPAAAAPAAAPAALQEHWDCTKDGNNPVGPVKITWGYKEGDATWACNKWLAGCANRCTASPLSPDDYNKIVSQEPGDRALVWYKNGKLHEVTLTTKGSAPIDEGFNDKKAGGIDKVWVPSGMRVCMKNRKRIDSIHPLGPGPLIAEGDMLEARDDADDIWLTTGNCPNPKPDGLKISASVFTLGMV